MSKRCDKCEHWYRLGGVDRLGECRNNPRYIARTAGQWCGEFRPSGTEEPEPVACGIIRSSYPNGCDVVCDSSRLHVGSRVEMRIVKGPEE